MKLLIGFGFFFSIVFGSTAFAGTFVCTSKEIPPYTIKLTYVDTEGAYTATIEYDGRVIAERGTGYNIQRKTKVNRDRFVSDQTEFELLQVSGVRYSVKARLDIGGGVLTLRTFVDCFPE